MEIVKRCGSCGYYPFCERTEGASGYCDKWIKREVELKLESKKKEVFNFKKIGE